MLSFRIKIREMQLQGCRPLPTSTTVAQQEEKLHWFTRNTRRVKNCSLSPSNSSKRQRWLREACSIQDDTKSVNAFDVVSFLAAAPPVLLDSHSEFELLKTIPIGAPQDGCVSDCTAECWLHSFIYCNQEGNWSGHIATMQMKQLTAEFFKTALLEGSGPRSERWIATLSRHPQLLQSRRKTLPWFTPCGKTHTVQLCSVDVTRPPTLDVYAQHHAPALFNALGKRSYELRPSYSRAKAP